MSLKRSSNSNSDKYDPERVRGDHEHNAFKQSMNVQFLHQVRGRLPLEVGETVVVVDSPLGHTTRLLLSEEPRLRSSLIVVCRDEAIERSCFEGDELEARGGGVRIFRGELSDLPGWGGFSSSETVAAIYNDGCRSDYSKCLGDMAPLLERASARGCLCQFTLCWRAALGSLSMNFLLLRQGLEELGFFVSSDVHVYSNKTLTGTAVIGRARIRPSPPEARSWLLPHPSRPSTQRRRSTQDVIEGIPLREKKVVRKQRQAARDIRSVFGASVRNIARLRRREVRVRLVSDGKPLKLRHRGGEMDNFKKIDLLVLRIRSAEKWEDVRNRLMDAVTTLSVSRGTSLILHMHNRVMKRMNLRAWFEAEKLLGAAGLARDPLLTTRRILPGAQDLVGSFSAV